MEATRLERSQEQRLCWMTKAQDGGITVLDSDPPGVHLGSPGLGQSQVTLLWMRHRAPAGNSLLFR